MSTFREQARDHLSERLLEGKSVGGLFFDALVESELNDSPRAVTQEIAGHLLGVAADAGDEHARVERQVAIRKFVQRLIDAYLDRNEELVRETAAEFAEEYAQEQAA